MKFFLFLFIATSFCVVTYTKPLDLGFDGLGDNCYGYNCPSGTKACSRTIKTSEDKNYLTTTIQCEDGRGGIIDKSVSSKVNPDPYTQVDSYSFSGNYDVRPSQLATSRGQLRKPIHYNNDVETFY